jgi:hypothetical protein
MKNFFVKALVLILCVQTTSKVLAQDDYQEAAKIRNIGHRVGAGSGEVNSHLPENSLIALKVALLGSPASERLIGGRKIVRPALSPIQFRSDFVYLEFDVQETYDGELVLFHDRTVQRMVPYDGENQKKLDRLALEIGKGISQRIDPKELKISQLTLSQLKTLDLAGVPGEKVPTLKEFLNGALAWGLVKPLTLEIKYLRTDKAKETMISELARFRDLWLQKHRVEFENKYDLDPSGVGFLSFPSKFKKAFGKKGSAERKYWCQRFNQHGFKKIYRTIFHSENLCSN